MSDKSELAAGAGWICLLQAAALCAALLAPGSADAVEGGPPSHDAPARAIGAFDRLFDGPHAGARAVHAKGLLCAGSFEPAPAAATISRAPHLSGAASAVLVRFSNFSGVPDAPDNDPLASPRGMAIKFILADGGDTDIVAHSYDGFPAATPDDFVAFLSALAAPDPRQLAALVATHPAARTFVETPQPVPTSYGTESYFGVNAFAFTNAAGAVRNGRYRVVPLAGVAHLSTDEAAGKPADYLARELAARLAAGPVRFRLDLQLAEPGDTLTDGTLRWPVGRPVVTLGTVTLNRLVAAADPIQRNVFFTPLNLVDGILPSDDPMLTLRSRSYRISQMRRSSEAAAGGPLP